MQPSWALLDPDDRRSVFRLLRNAVDYEFWREMQPTAEEQETQDWTTLMAGMTRSTATQPGHITANLDALATLDRLPGLRALVEKTWILDMHYLGVIDRAATRAPQRLQEDPYFWEALDDDLVDRLTPSKPHQLLPAPWTIRRVVEDTITALQTQDDHPAWPPAPEPDPPPEPEPGNEEDVGEDGDEGTAGPQPCVDPAELMRSLPPLDDTPAPGLWIDTEDSGTMRFELSVDQATGTLLRDAVWQVAKAADVSQARAMVMLLLGQVTTTVTTHLYTARDVAGAPVFHPLAGVLTEQAAAKLLAMSGRTTDMDAAAGAYTPSYTPTGPIRAFLVGRDGLCRWPGCTTPALGGDNDHRINHDEGGPTMAANMVMLCRHHHNRKTDVQAAYLLDPVTGDVYWLFADGRWAVDHAEGPLAPGKKRWVQTFAQRRRRRSERAAARAAAKQFEEYQAGVQERAEREASHNLAPPETEEPVRDPPDD